MAVLELKPTAAPNLTGTSQILARAGLSMDRGFESAKGLLGAYQDGQSEKADNEVAGELSALTSREEVEAWLKKGGAGNRPITQDMRTRIATALGDMADINSTRAGTAETLSGTTRAEAVEARAAELRADQIGARDADRAGAQADAAALRDARAGVVTPTPAAGPIATAVGDAPAASAAAPTAPAGPEGDTQRNFMGTVAAGFTAPDGTVVEGVKNPFALAVIGATGQHEHR